MACQWFGLKMMHHKIVKYKLTCVRGDWLLNTNRCAFCNGFSLGAGSGWLSISTINGRGVCSLRTLWAANAGKVNSRSARQGWRSVRLIYCKQNLHTELQTPPGMKANQKYEIKMPKVHKFLNILGIWIIFYTCFELQFLISHESTITFLTGSTPMSEMTAGIFQLSNTKTCF